MTTQDLERREQRGAVAIVPTPAEAVSAAIEQWVGGLAASVRGAEFIVDTPLCPDSLWPLPPGTQLSKVPGKNPKVQLPGEDRESFLARRQVAAYSLGGIVRYGLQLGIPPEVATQGLFPIGGRISMYADQMVALVKSHGHRHRIVQRTAEVCTIEVQRMGEEPQQFTYTIDDAIMNGYVPGKGPNAKLGNWPDGKPKTGGNDKYLTDPAGMLEARCNSTGLTAVFPDVLRGLVSVEAMRDEQRVTVTAEEYQTPARMSAAALLARAADRPPVDHFEGTSAAGGPDPDPVVPQVRTSSDVPPEPEVTRYVLPVSKGRLDVIKAAFEAIGIGGRALADRDARRAVLSAIVDRPIEDPREMTADEGALVQDNLTGDAGRSLCARVLDRPDLLPQERADEDMVAANLAHLAERDESLPDPTAGGDAWAGDR